MLLTEKRSRASSLRQHLRSPLKVWILSALAVYVALVVCGATTSSIGISSLRDRPNEHVSGLLGGPDSIRSDEYLRTSPWRIGLLSSGDDSFGTSLSNSDFALVTNALGGPATTVLFGDTASLVAFGRLLPTQVFAAVWWLPVLLVWLLVPLWFRRLGVGLRVSGPVTLLVVLSPVAVWWSWTALGGLAWALLAAVAGAAAVDRSRRVGASWGGAALTLVTGLALARLALSYQPWAIPLGLTVLIPTLALLLLPGEGRRRTILVLGLSACVSLLALGAFVLEHRTGLDVLANTVYPGARRFIGARTNLASMFAAPHLWVLQDTPRLTATNQSEISSGYLVLALVSLAAVPAVDWRRLDELRVVTFASGGVLAALASWCAIDWPERADRLFPISLVSPERLVQVIGISATLTFGLMMAAWIRAPLCRRRTVAVTAALLAFFVTAAGGSAFRDEFLPSYRTAWIALVSLLASVAIGVSLGAASRRWALIPLAAMAIPVVGLVNPVQVGFADLRSGKAAAEVKLASKTLHPGMRWATDDLHADALLMANAAPAVSGQQWVGPETKTWRILDPKSVYREEWNRGAAYVVFAWADPGTATRVDLPSPDLIRVTADPCNPAVGRLHVGLILSTHPLEGRCLVRTGRFSFGGQARWMYRVTAPR